MKEFLNMYVIILVIIVCYCFYDLIKAIVNQLEAEKKLATLLSNSDEFWKIVENENDIFQVAVFIKTNCFNLLNKREQSLIEQGLFQYSIKGRTLYLNKIIKIAKDCKNFRQKN